MHRFNSVLLALAAGLASTATADTVLIGTTTGSILGYDTDSGSVSFVAAADTPVHGLTTIGRRGYYSNGDGVVTEFDLDTNLTVRQFAARPDLTSITTDGESLLVAGTEGEIQRIDPETGEIMGSVFVPTGSLTSVGVHWGFLYHGGLSTFAERVPLASAFPENNFELFAVCGGAINSMTFAGIDVVLGSLNGNIYRYDEFNGTYGDVHSVGVDSVGITALVGGRLLVADSSGTLIEVDYQTGEILRSTDAGAPIGAIHAIDVGDACPADLDLTGVLDLGDIQTFVMLAIDGRLGADLNGDGAVDLTDVGLFVAEFTAGCP